MLKSLGQRGTMRWVTQTHSDPFLHSVLLHPSPAFLSFRGFRHPSSSHQTDHVVTSAHPHILLQGSLPEIQRQLSLSLVSAELLQLLGCPFAGESGVPEGSSLTCPTGNRFN